MRANGSVRTNTALDQVNLHNQHPVLSLLTSSKIKIKQRNRYVLCFPWHQVCVRCYLASHHSKKFKKKCPLSLVKLIQSFLLSRSGRMKSSVFLVFDILLGCPQGSILSPFLWNILLEELLNLSFPFLFSIIAYADDIVLCTFDKCPFVAQKNLHEMCVVVEALGGWI